MKCRHCERIMDKRNPMKSSPIKFKQQNGLFFMTHV